MTSIEERLADALNASYEAARALPLRPLALTPPRPRRWVLWFAPVAAALAVVAVVTGLNALTGRAPAPQRPAGPVAAGAGGVPRYYVDLNDNGQDVVRSVATGKVTGTVPVHFTSQDGAAASTSVDGVFYVAGYAAGREEIYRFKLTSAGQVTGLATVKGTDTLGGQIDAMAASPEGTKLALAISHGPSGSDSITVISLPGGARRSWQGGVAVNGYRSFTITSLSWLAGDERLAFTGLWCQYGHGGTQVCGNAQGGVRHLTGVRALRLAGRGSSLSQARVLLRQSATVPYIAAAAISPDGATITAVVLSGPVRYSSPGTVPGHLAVRQFTTATGQPSRTLYQRATGPTAGWLLSPDSTGRHYLLSGAAVYAGDGPPSLQGKGYNGRISDAKLINLPPSSGELYGQAW